MMNILQRLGREDSGQSLVGYALVAGIVSLILEPQLPDVLANGLDGLAFWLRTASAQLDILW